MLGSLSRRSGHGPVRASADSEVLKAGAEAQPWRRRSVSPRKGTSAKSVQPGVCTEAADQLPVTSLRHPFPYI